MKMHYLAEFWSHVTNRVMSSRGKLPNCAVKYGTPCPQPQPSLPPTSFFADLLLLDSLSKMLSNYPNPS